MLCYFTQIYVNRSFGKYCFPDFSSQLIKINSHSFAYPFLGLYKKKQLKKR